MHARLQEAEARAVEQHLDLGVAVDIVGREGEGQLLRRAGEGRGDHAVGVGRRVELVAEFARLGHAECQTNVSHRTCLSSHCL